jgi:Predicted membrane protein
MARLAVLAAILIVMGFTPLGYLKVNPAMTITFNMIPVVIGAIVLGPSGGAILGLVFGLTSFSQALTGADVLGTMLLNQSALSAVLLFVMCVVPRVLAGLLPGLLFRALNKGANDEPPVELRRMMAIVLTTLCGSVANTVFFISAFVGFFGTNELVTSAFGTTSIWSIVLVLLTINALVEAVVCAVVGTTIGRVMLRFVPKNK